jgi:hypothetical protein
MMHRVLLDLQQLPQNIDIAVDFSHHYCTGKRYERACLATFFALATSRTKIYSLAFDDFTFRHMDDILAYDRANSLASMTNIHTLESYAHDWQSTSSKNEQPMFTEIFRSAEELRHLTFDIIMHYHEEISMDRNCPLLNVPPEILLAGHYSKLESLRLMHFAATESDLCHMLQQCQSSLTHLTLRLVRLKSGDGGWKRIGEILLTGSKLAYLQLQITYASNVPYGKAEGEHIAFNAPEVKDGRPPGFTVKGRDSIMRAVGKLAQLGSTLF